MPWYRCYVLVGLMCWTACCLRTTRYWFDSFSFSWEVFWYHADSWKLEESLHWPVVVDSSKYTRLDFLSVVAIGEGIIYIRAKTRVWHSWGCGRNWKHTTSLEGWAHITSASFSWSKKTSCLYSEPCARVCWRFEAWRSHQQLWRPQIVQICSHKILIKNK